MKGNMDSAVLSREVPPQSSRSPRPHPRDRSTSLFPGCGSHHPASSLGHLKARESFAFTHYPTRLL